MELQIQDIANVRLIHVEGRIDHTTVQSFQDLLLPKLTDCTGETKKALLDLNGVNGTFQNRAKVVDSMPGQLSAMAGCRHNLALKQSVQAG